jgi:hypothetical protein
MPFRPPGWVDPAGRNLFLILDLCTTYGNRETSIYGCGRDDLRGPGPCGFNMISEAPIFAYRRAAMISPQRHQDHRENSQLCVGNNSASAPCPHLREGRLSVPQWWRFVRNKANSLRPGPRGRQSCKTNPICTRGRGSVGQAPPYTSTRLRQTRRARQKSASTEPIHDIGPETRVEIRLGDFCRGRQTNPIRPGPAFVGGGICEANPICSRGKGPVGQAPPYTWTRLRQTNKPNFAGLARRRNTQHSTVLSFHHSSPTPLCKTIGKLRGGFPIATYPDWEPELRLPLPPVAATLGPGLCRRGGRECWRVAGRPADNYNGRRPDYIGLGRIPLVMRYDGVI